MSTVIGWIPNAYPVRGAVGQATPAGNGNLILYDDCLVFASLVGVRLLIGGLLAGSVRKKVEGAAPEQAKLSPEELVAQHSHSWRVAYADLADAEYETEGGGGESAGRVVAGGVGGKMPKWRVEILTLKLLDGTTKRVVHQISSNSSGWFSKTKTYPDSEDLLRRALGDKLTMAPAS